VDIFKGLAPQFAEIAADCNSRISQETTA
jgi:hypothetical protein